MSSHKNYQYPNYRSVCQEVGRPLDRGEEMLDRLTLHAHFLRMLIETSLHRLDHVLMLHRAMRRSGPVLHCDLSDIWNIWV